MEDRQILSTIQMTGEMNQQPDTVLDFLVNSRSNLDRTRSQELLVQLQRAVNVVAYLQSPEYVVYQTSISSNLKNP